MTGGNANVEPLQLNCYNRGCGQKFNPNDNDRDECRHHPGLPFFHDAYKGWSCCNKKCTDFTEFLNIKGCTLGKHSNEKPPEMPKAQVDKGTAHEVIEVKMPSPLKKSSLVRPPFDSPLKTVVPTVAELLKNISIECPKKEIIHVRLDDNVVVIGTCCKNGGCRGTYEDVQSDSEKCIHHPGVPIFHEGMKYWSCCQKKTSDFNTFLNQAGCSTGIHKWKKDTPAAHTVNCRWDWHQTATHVIVTVYAKNYDPVPSFVKLNPVRLCLQLDFPEEGNSKFDLDLELRGIIDPDASSASMLSTKLEVKLRKAEAGSWVNLDFPRAKEETKKVEENSKQAPQPHTWDTKHDDVDLDDLQVL